MSIINLILFLLPLIALLFLLIGLTQVSTRLDQQVNRIKKPILKTLVHLILLFIEVGLVLLLVAVAVRYIIQIAHHIYHIS